MEENNQQGRLESLARTLMEVLSGTDSFIAIAHEGLPLRTWGFRPECEGILAVLEGTLHSLRRTEELREASSITIGLGRRALFLKNSGELHLIVECPKKLLPVIEGLVERVIYEATVKCSSCGGVLDLAVIRCPHCGGKAPASARECPHCGRELGPRSCPWCGALVDWMGRFPPRIKNEGKNSALFLVFGAGLGFAAGVAVYTISLIFLPETARALATVLAGMAAGLGVCLSYRSRG